MPHFKHHSKQSLSDERNSIQNQNGSQQPMRRQQKLGQPAPNQARNPYEDDPLFKTALSYYKVGKFEEAMSSVDELLKRYPGDNHLEIFKKKIRKQISRETHAFRHHPSFISLRNNIKSRNWVAASQAADELLLSFPNSRAISDIHWKLSKQVNKQESRTRIKLIGAIVFLALMLISMGVVVAKYVSQPAPLSEILVPNAGLKYPPHYLFSIYDTDQPVGVGLSQDGERIYVTEMGGERMVKIFDRSGHSLGSFTSPKTSASERAPVYVATDSSGQVYVSDRIQHAIFVFSPDGSYIDALLGPDLTLSEYVIGHAGNQTRASGLAYNLFEKSIFLSDSSSGEQTLASPDLPAWSPLGIRIGQNNEMILTDVSKNNNRVIEISLANTLSRLEWNDFDPAAAQYGKSGSGNGEMLFPNSAAADSQGRVYVSDGNNRRISVWDSEGNFLFNFGSGTGPGSLSLPRGLFIDRHDRLYVVDTVAQNVKVYDISSSQPVFLFEFGDFGKGDGFFNFPNDIAIDKSGRIYIADRENNRIEVWSY